MCAMMPMFRVFSSECDLGIALPAIVSEGLVGFSHPMRVFALLDGASAEVRRVHELVRELFLHRLAIATRARVADEPPDAQREAPVRVHFHGHLIVRPADAARLHFE